MSTYLIPGLLGLVTGLLLHWGELSRAEGLRSALGLRRSLPLRTSLTALGWGVALSALLMWLAVLDVEEVAVLPLSLGALLGGVVFGASAGLCGFTPTTAFAGLGGGNALEALCTLAGCALMTWLPAKALLRPLQDMSPYADAPLFRIALGGPCLLEGGFLGLGCLGALLIVWGMCVPSPRAVLLPDEAIARQAEKTPVPPAEPAAPESAPEETIVMALEGEEPLVIDTGLDEAGSGEETDSADGSE